MKIMVISLKTFLEKKQKIKIIEIGRSKLKIKITKHHRLVLIMFVSVWRQQLNLDLGLGVSHVVTVTALTCCKIIPRDAMRTVPTADWHVSVPELQKTTPLFEWTGLFTPRT